MIFRTIQWSALLFGFGSATVVASVVALLVWGGISVSGTDADVTGPVIGGVVAGLFAAGYVASRLSRRKMFHGTLAALAFGFGVTVASILEGSPSSPVRLVWFMVLSAGIGAAGALLGARAKA